MTRKIAEIVSYHAHVYYDPARTRGNAEALRSEAGERFPIRLGRWWDERIGPHSSAMFQIAFETMLFKTLVPWLMLNHRGLSILVHPNTLNPRRDHVEDGLWIGRPLAIRSDRLPDEVANADEAGLPNTAPVRNAEI